MQGHGLIPVPGSILNPFPISSSKSCCLTFFLPVLPCISSHSHCPRPAFRHPSLRARQSRGCRTSLKRPRSMHGHWPMILHQIPAGHPLAEEGRTQLGRRRVVLPHPCPPSSPLAPQLLRPLCITVTHRSADGCALYYPWHGLNQSRRLPTIYKTTKHHHDPRQH